MPNTPFYKTKEWKAARLQALRRDHFKCAFCGASLSRKGASRVDHIIPRRSRPDLALSLDNLRSLCVPCDNRRHAEKGRAGLKAQGKTLKPESACNDTGHPSDPAHPWNS